MPKVALGSMISLVFLLMIFTGCQTTVSVEDTTKSDSIVDTNYHPAKQISDDDLGGLEDDDEDTEEPEPAEAEEETDDTKENLSELALTEAQYKSELTAAARYTLAKANEEIQAGRLNSAQDLLKDVLNQLSPYAASSSELTNYYTQLLNLSHKVDTLLGKNTDGISSGVSQSYNQLVDEARVEVRKNFEDGKTAMQEKQFEDAIASFEKALEVIRWAPYAKDLEENFKAEVQTYKKQAGKILQTGPLSLLRFS